MQQIEGRVAFVTGGASGIGLAIAVALIRAGARLMLADIDEDALSKAASQLGARAATVRLDVRDRDGWAIARTKLETHFGPLDILVNNAGIGPDGHRLADMDPIAFDRIVAIKLTGTFNGIATFAPGLRDRRQGHIVNTASMAGLIASPRLGAYTAAKFAVVGMSEVLRAELAPHGVGVSVLCPGLVQTNLGATTAAAGSDRIALDPAMAATGIDAAVVGELVIEGIRADAAYILTHAQFREAVARRMATLLAAFDDAGARG